jgi:pimeloyl-ACP methyl ester carboxylesterase
MNVRRLAVLAAAVTIAGGNLPVAEAGMPFSEAADSLHTVTVNGVALHYLDEGQGEPVVLVHGSAGDYRAWRGQMGPLAKKYRVIAYSRRWHHPNTGGGESDYTVARHAQDLLGLMDALKLGSVHLIGHSYGGQVAAVVARDHPDRVRSLVLCEPAFMGLLEGTPEAETYKAEQQETYMRARLSMRDGFPEIALGAVIDWTFGWPGFDSFPPKAQEALKDNLDAFRHQLELQRPDPAFGAADVRRLHGPVLFVEGDKSPEMRHKIGDAFMAARPTTERLVLRGGHGMPWTSTGGFNRGVLKFLDAHDAEGVASK